MMDTLGKDRMGMDHSQISVIAKVLAFTFMSSYDNIIGK